jgi:phytoene dehydrogenase-like protein
MREGSCDVAVVGGGPNGLTAAAGLARAGAKVMVLERRFERGGTFATDDYSTPFLYNIAQFALPLGTELPPFRDLGLHAHGVRFIEPEVPFAVATAPGNEPLLVRRGGVGLGAKVEEMVASASRAVLPLLYRPPQDEDDVIAELLGDGEQGAVALAEETPSSIVSAVDDERTAIVLRYACALAGFLEDDVPFGVIGGFALARQFSPSIVLGGTKNLTNALYRDAASHHARCYVTSEVVAIDRDDDGFRLHMFDGEVIGARAVVSTLDPSSTFTGLLDPDLVPGELAKRMEAWEVEPTGPLTAHFGIRGSLPAPPSEGVPEPLARIIGFSSLDDVSTHLEAVREGRMPRSAAGHVSLVTAHDVQQASPGPYGPLHTIRFQTFVPFRHPDGSWDAVRGSSRERCYEMLLSHLDGLSDARLLFQFSDSPEDVERRFRTTRNGSLRQGSLIRRQTLTGRPDPSCADTRTPVPGLYLGGGGVHPGVPGTLGGGWLAAQAVCSDLGFEPSWVGASAGGADG